MRQSSVRSLVWKCTPISNDGHGSFFSRLKNKWLAWCSRRKRLPPYEREHVYFFVFAEPYRNEIIIMRDCVYALSREDALVQAAEISPSALRIALMNAKEFDHYYQVVVHRNCASLAEHLLEEYLCFGPGVADSENLLLVSSLSESDALLRYRELTGVDAYVAFNVHSFIGFKEYIDLFCNRKI